MYPQFLKRKCRVFFTSCQTGTTSLSPICPIRAVLSKRGWLNERKWLLRHRPFPFRAIQHIYPQWCKHWNAENAKCFGDFICHGKWGAQEYLEHLRCHCALTSLFWLFLMSELLILWNAKSFIRVSAFATHDHSRSVMVKDAVGLSCAYKAGVGPLWSCCWQRLWLKCNVSFPAHEREASDWKTWVKRLECISGVRKVTTAFSCTQTVMWLQWKRWVRTGFSLGGHDSC